MFKSKVGFTFKGSLKAVSQELMLTRFFLAASYNVFDKRYLNGVLVLRFYLISNT